MQTAQPVTAVCLHLIWLCWRGTNLKKKKNLLAENLVCRFRDFLVGGFIAVLLHTSRFLIATLNAPDETIFRSWNPVHHHQEVNVWPAAGTSHYPGSTGGWNLASGLLIGIESVLINHPDSFLTGHYKMRFMLSTSPDETKGWLDPMEDASL